VSRDRHRDRVYEAQHLVERLFDRAPTQPVVDIAGSRLVLPVERHFGTVPDVETYLTKALGLPWIRAGFPRAKIPLRVRERRGQSRAVYEALAPDAAGTPGVGVIAIPPYRAGRAWALRELVVLHELAHHLTDPAEPSHGSQFLSTYLRLVDGLIGPEAALLLRITLHDVGADF
jgi:putative metallohydrolase (TIGR04338 family)